MKKYLIATALILGTVANPIKCTYEEYKTMATVSTLASMAGASLMLQGNGNQGSQILFGGATVAALVGIVFGNSPSISCLASYGPALGILLVTKLCASLMDNKDSKKNS